MFNKKLVAVLCTTAAVLIALQTLAMLIGYVESFMNVSFLPVFAPSVADAKTRALLFIQQLVNNGVFYAIIASVRYFVCGAPSSKK